MNTEQLKQVRNNLLRLSEDYIRAQTTYSDENLDKEIHYTELAIEPGPIGDDFIDEEFTAGLKQYLEILMLVKNDRIYNKVETKGKDL